ncbi:hypothetical protein QUF90_07445 [Desulfococcaceae bacterium HSG9]|nr:hypothetical protein [Desulfococcaceae bacterium HSG9]
MMIAIDAKHRIIFHNMPPMDGWRIECLPWTYRMDKKLMYQPDIKK